MKYHPPNHPINNPFQFFPVSFKDFVKEGVFVLEPIFEQLLTEGLIQHRAPPLRSSNLETLAACPRRFMWREKLGLRHRYEYASALALGQMFHNIVAATFKSSAGRDGGLAGAIDAETTEVDAVRLRLLEGTGTARQIWAEETGRKMQDDLNKACMMATIFFRQPFSIFDLYPARSLIEEPIEADTRYGKMRGRLDLVLHETRDGIDRLWIVDFKTLDASVSTLDRAAQISFDPQPYIYRHLLRAIHSDLEPYGTIHIIVQKPNLKFCAKDHKAARGTGKSPFDCYVGRCAQDFYEARFVAARLDCSVGPPMLVRTMPFRSSEDPPWFHARALDYQKETQRPADTANFFPIHSACFKYNRRCPFLDLCKAAPSTWRTEIKSNYESVFREDEE